MEITAIKTDPIVSTGSITDLLDRYIPGIHENDIVVITSKIVSICQGRVKRIANEEEKKELIRRESEWYIEDEATKRYNVILTITEGLLIPSAGIDESNGNGFCILWPTNPMKEASKIWEHLRTKHHINKLGVIITDSHTTPLRWGTSGVAIAWSGFEPLHNYIGSPDIFGRNLKMTKANILDGLAASAVLTMGEGNEQTPLAIIKNASMVKFTNHAPTKEEIADLHIKPEDDIYSPLLTSTPWIKNS